MTLLCVSCWKKLNFESWEKWSYVDWKKTDRKTYEGKCKECGIESKNLYEVALKYEFVINEDFEFDDEKEDQKFLGGFNPSFIKRIAEIDENYEELE